MGSPPSSVSMKTVSMAVTHAAMSSASVNWSSWRKDSMTGARKGTPRRWPGRRRS